MTTRQLLTCASALSCSFALAALNTGCACHKNPGLPEKSLAPESASVGRIDFAEFTGSRIRYERHEIMFSGERFKRYDVTTSDVMTRTPDAPAPGQREWKNALNVIGHSGFAYHIRSAHSSAHSRVQVKVRLDDGNWSNAFDVTNPNP
jgi:hypothetical protein